MYDTAKTLPKDQGVSPWSENIHISSYRSRSLSNHCTSISIKELAILHGFIILIKGICSSRGWSPTNQWIKQLACSKHVFNSVSSALSHSLSSWPVLKYSMCLGCGTPPPNYSLPLGQDEACKEAGRIVLWGHSASMVHWNSQHLRESPWQCWCPVPRLNAVNIPILAPKHHWALKPATVRRTKDESAALDWEVH